MERATGANEEANPRVEDNDERRRAQRQSVAATRWTMFSFCSTILKCFVDGSVTMVARGNGVHFDADGPRLGDYPLLIKSALGFTPRSLDDLAEMFVVADATQAKALRRFQYGLAGVARAMTAGDVGLAAIATSRLSLGSLPPARSTSDVDIPPFLKAAVDDPKHPGYPARTPGGKGGQFRPKGDAGPVQDDTGGPFTATGENPAKRIAQRRGFRAAVRRILTTKRLMRLLSQNAVAGLTEEVPGLDAITTAEAIAEDMKIVQDIATEVRDSDAAVSFLEHGPVELGAIEVSTEELQFSSFDAFKKVDLEKYFGSAGDGFDYHHIVEQGPNAGVLPEELLQSTDNIVKIPRLLHEEVNSLYNTTDNTGMTPRDYLRGKSYEEQREFGLKALRKIGILN